MEPSDYKHVALGLIFLKHISDGFELKKQERLAEHPEGPGLDGVLIQSTGLDLHDYVSAR
jgi:type I restriction-modification system DNA methylase subunit